MSVWTPSVERIIGGWPDGITPGFVELGVAPTSGAGFAAPIGSVAKVGTTYYSKIGGGNTAWVAIPIVTPTPQTARKPGEWYAWGGREYSDGGAGGEFAGGTGVVAGGAVGQMMAILAFFPEAITLTGLAMGLIADTAGENGWVGVAPDSLVSGVHYPGATVAASSTSIIGLAAGGRRLRGSTSLSVAIPANSFYWAVFQTKVGFGAGAIWVAFDRLEWPSLFGIQSMSGKAIGDALPASPISYSGGFGWESPSAAPPAYALGTNFPAGVTTPLNNSNTPASVLWGNRGCPFIWFQFTR